MAEPAREIVFISYRRSDSKDMAGRIYDKLDDALHGTADVYMDVDSIAPGKNFGKHLDEALERTRVMLVVIGPTWLHSTKESDLTWWRRWFPFLNGIFKPSRRLDDPEDFVRREIRSALPKRRITILPVLVNNARMPESHELPEDLRALTDWQALALRHESFRENSRTMAQAVMGALSEPDPSPSGIKRPQPVMETEPKAVAPIAPAPAGLSKEEQPAEQPIEPESPEPLKAQIPGPPITTEATEAPQLQPTLEQSSAREQTTEPVTPVAQPAEVRHPSLVIPEPVPKSKPARSREVVLSERAKLIESLENLCKSMLSRDASERHSASVASSNRSEAYRGVVGADRAFHVYNAAHLELKHWSEGVVAFIHPVSSVVWMLGCAASALTLAIRGGFYAHLKTSLLPTLQLIVKGIISAVGSLLGKLFPFIEKTVAPLIIDVLHWVLGVLMPLVWCVEVIFTFYLIGFISAVIINYCARPFRKGRCEKVLERARKEINEAPQM